MKTGLLGTITYLNMYCNYFLVLEDSTTCILILLSHALTFRKYAFSIPTVMKCALWLREVVPEVSMIPGSRPAARREKVGR